jgi:hypothetical protein
MGWHQISMSKIRADVTETENITAIFEKQYMAASGPKGMTLFVNIDLNSETAMFYFSPASTRHIQSLLNDYEAKSCKVPDVSCLTVLAGDAEYFAPQLADGKITFFGVQQQR